MLSKDDIISYLFNNVLYLKLKRKRLYDQIPTYKPNPKDYYHQWGRTFKKAEDLILHITDDESNDEEVFERFANVCKMFVMIEDQMRSLELRIRSIEEIRKD